MADYRDCLSLEGGPCLHYRGPARCEGGICTLQHTYVKGARQCGFLDYYLKVKERSE